jgi:hypothetical protein
MTSCAVQLRNVGLGVAFYAEDHEVFPVDPGNYDMRWWKYLPDGSYMPKECLYDPERNPWTPDMSYGWNYYAGRSRDFDAPEDVHRPERVLLVADSRGRKVLHPCSWNGLPDPDWFIDFQRHLATKAVALFADGRAEPNELTDLTDGRFSFRNSP